MLTVQNILLFLSILLSALIMGLMCGYACSVNPGLNKLPDTAYLQAMQSINVQIQNPVFFISFAGTFVLLPLTTWYSKSHASSCFYCMMAATVLYIVGVAGTTALGNIPLNNALAKFNIPTATAAEISARRIAFETPWNRFHLLRTLFSIAATAFAIAAVFKNNAQQS